MTLAKIKKAVKLITVTLVLLGLPLFIGAMIEHLLWPSMVDMFIKSFTETDIWIMIPCLVSALVYMLTLVLTVVSLVCMYAGIAEILLDN